MYIRGLYSEYCCCWFNLVGDKKKQHKNNHMGNVNVECLASTKVWNRNTKALETSVSNQELKNV